MKNDQKIHLSKFLATSGVASRRKVVEEIKKGLVAVNETTITEPGHVVREGDTVTYKGQHVKPEKKVYIILNKPKGYITSTADERGRKTVMDLIQTSSKQTSSVKNLRLFPIGRLDRNTTGILLLTNDGELAQKLSHPRYQTSKIYRVTLDRPLVKADLNKLHLGIRLQDGFIKPDHVYTTPGSRRYEVVIEIHSGKNRIVRRIFESLQYDIKKLDRSQYAGLTKKNLPSRSWRFLTPLEIKKLKENQ
jgi:23S rRNA pseudouridine2605 synthase